MVDLSTTFLGMQLKNPLVASSSPLTQKLDTIHQLEEAGVGAVVMYSLFEEQILHESLRLHKDMLRGTESFAESLNYLPDIGQYTIGPDMYVENIRKIKKAVHIPIIGSLNGISTGGWIEYASRIEQAGADGLELNLYDLTNSMEIGSEDIENAHITLVHDIRTKVQIPIAVKLSPFYTALPKFASRLVEAGANGLVLFNRFYQPDLDLEKLEVLPHLTLSNSNELRLPLRWIAILSGRLQTDLALTSGVHTSEDVIKAIMAGANVAYMASELLQNGIQRVPEIIDGIRSWMEEREYESVAQMKGSMSQKSVGQPANFERANYMKVLSSY